ncbi:GntR family transcriptional regulator [Sphingomonas lycopersici]|uniref:GntR family transcriptional regulator n=1 Tax=Sphingomonas lycopersici TaxID=2951807 RepID=A0AA42CP80_9SPHN|nr:GntR family transcriptional regulator [Sphingomonas lycopersici]MCW6534064.1 GntR family transcriptional regulator [Sphingomonas lycopersici]
MTNALTRHGPLYIRIAAELRAGILSRRWQPGDQLPSEAQLCREYGVSRGTVVRAIEILLQEGLAHRRQGDGTYVSRPSLHRQPGFLTGFSHSVRDQGRVPAHRILGFTRLSAAEAQQYGCGGPAVRLSRLRLVDDTPWALHNSVVPEQVAERVPALTADGVELLHAADFSLYQAMEEAGVHVDHAEELLRARAATPEEAALLGVPSGTALMAINRRAYDAAGRIVELVETNYVGDSYSYETRLTRDRGVAHMVSQVADRH